MLVTALIGSVLTASALSIRRIGGPIGALTCERFKMNWEKRLRELLLAGGTLALVGCSDGSPEGNLPDSQGGQGGGGRLFCGNANPDPCICGRPQESNASAQLCERQQACEARGGTFDPVTNIALDGSSIPPHCSLGPDIEIDAGMTNGGVLSAAGNLGDAEPDPGGAGADGSR